MRKDRIDAAGAAMLVGFCFLFALNQVAIKVSNGGFQPVFGAALRSAVAILCILAYMRLRGRPVGVEPGTLRAGLLIGALFSAEFVLLFMALDLTTVSRTSVIFYTMPIWLALAAHFLLPGDRLTPRRLSGLVLAFAGMAWALLDRGMAGGAVPSLAGDLCALGAALAWAGIALCARGTAMARVGPEKQLLWQVAVSVPVLALAAPFFGPFLREPAAIHVAALLFQAVVVVTFGFIAWLWTLARYPASSVAAFSFLTPVVGVALGHALLDEPVAPALVGALVLVAAGLVLVNGGRARRT